MATVSVSELDFNTNSAYQNSERLFHNLVVYKYQPDVMTRLKLFAVCLGSLGPGLLVMLLGLLMVVNRNIGL